MKWEYASDSNSGKTTNVFVMQKDTVRELQKLIPKSLLTKLKKNADKYYDRHMSGFGDGKDYDKYQEWSEKAALLEKFLNA